MSGESSQGLRIETSFTQSDCHPERSWAHETRPTKSKDLRFLFGIRAFFLLLLLLLTSVLSARSETKIKDADFDPDVYPMNGAWWDGKMPLDHYREEHGLDAETLGDSGKGAGESPTGAPAD
jgi:hypothetical protein